MLEYVLNMMMDLNMTRTRPKSLIQKNKCGHGAGKQQDLCAHSPLPLDLNFCTNPTSTLKECPDVEQRALVLFQLNMLLLMIWT